MIRYFEIRTPDPSFAGQIAGINFLDGYTRVSLDGDPAVDDSTGTTLGTNDVQAGRALLRYARNRANDGYVVTEVNAAGQPLTPESTR